MTGLIIGLLIGLAIALGVALYVAKVPVPFLDKVPQRTAEQDLAEQEKNKNWQPNAPLAGKNPARPVAVPAAPASQADEPASASTGRDPASILAGGAAPATASDTVPVVTEPKTAAATEKRCRAANPMIAATRAQNSPAASGRVCRGSRPDSIVAAASATVWPRVSAPWLRSCDRCPGRSGP